MKAKEIVKLLRKCIIKDRELVFINLSGQRFRFYSVSTYSHENRVYIIEEK